MAAHHPPHPPAREQQELPARTGIQRFLTSPFLRISRATLLRRRLVADLHGYRPLGRFVLVLVVIFGLLTVTEFFALFQAARSLGVLDVPAPVGPGAMFLAGTARWQARLCTFVAIMVLIIQFVGRANQNARALGGDLAHDDSGRVISILAAPISNVLVQAYGPVVLDQMHGMLVGHPHPHLADFIAVLLASSGIIIYMLAIWQVDALARAQHDRYRALARDPRWR